MRRLLEPAAVSAGIVFLSFVAPSSASAQALSLGLGAAATSTSVRGAGVAVTLAYEATGRRGLGAWVAMQGIHDTGIDGISPGFRQSATDWIVSAGPTMHFRRTEPVSVIAGVGAYAAATRFSQPRPTGSVARGAYWGLGDGGGLGRLGVRLRVSSRTAVVASSEWRFSFDSDRYRTLLPGITVGYQRTLR